MTDKFQSSLAKAEALILAGQYSEAEAAYSDLDLRFPKRPAGLYGLVKIAKHRCKHESVLELTTHCRQRFPNFPALLYERSQALLKLNKINEAQDVLKDLQERFPDRPKFASGYLTLAIQQHCTSELLEVCYRHVSRFPESARFTEIAMQILMKLERFDDAANYGQQLINSKQDSFGVRLALSRAALKQDEIEGAIEHATEAATMRSDNPTPLVLIGTYLITGGRHGEAVEHLKRVLVKFPEHAMAHAVLARAYSALAEDKAALNAVERSYAIDPKNQHTIKTYVAILGQLGQSEKAQSILECYIEEVDDDSKHSLLVTIVELYSKTGQHQQISQLFQSVKQIFSSDISLSLMAGIALVAQGELRGAFELFQNVLSSNAEKPDELRSRYRIYNQALMLYQISLEADLLQHRHFDAIKLPKPSLFGETSPQQLSPHDVKLTEMIMAYDQELADLGRLFSENFLEAQFTPSKMIDLADFIIERIQNKSPTSIIRLGDGEGHFLPYESDDLQWQEYDQGISQQTWWGGVKLGGPDGMRVISSFRDAIANADVIGIPDLERLVFINQNASPAAASGESRGLRAILNWLRHQKGESESATKRAALASCHFHTHLERWDLYRYIFTEVTKATVISCHTEIGSLMRDRFGIADVTVTPIPAEYRHASKITGKQIINDHYPSCYNSILNNLHVTAGEVFLVAAGFLGKIYCAEIKKQGGIAIDIGSIVDVWSGFSTRREQQFQSRIGVGLDLPRLRARKFSHVSTARRTTCYRSNYYADMNIFQEEDWSAEFEAKITRSLLAIGSPRCGSAYFSALLNHMGLQINHESIGRDGICSWLFAVQDLNMPTFQTGLDPTLSYRTDFNYKIAYIRNPYAAIPSLLIENCHADQRSYNFRRSHILDRLDVDLNDYQNDLERAAASYVFWNQIVWMAEPERIFKVEDCVLPVHDYLVEKKLIPQKFDTSKIQLSQSMNSTSQRGHTKRKVLLADWDRITPELRASIERIAERYGYAEI